MSIEVLDPTHESDPAEFSPAPRLPRLRGARVGIISNGKQGTEPFFDALARELRDAHGVAEVRRLTKANYSAPAEAAVWQQAAGLDALITGVGD
jgi:hypothetical protein